MSGCRKNSSHGLRRIYAWGWTIIALGRLWRKVRKVVGYAYWRIAIPAYQQCVYWGAVVYRVRLQRVVFVGVDGSCGKTTTKELIAAVLSSQFKGHRSPGSINEPYPIAKTIFTVSPRNTFYVQEVDATEPGVIDQSLRLVKPRIGVVTNVGTDHLSAFRTPEAIAAENSKLVAALPYNGFAVLNVDDPNVIAMRSRCKGRVITYGLAQEAMVKAEQIRSIWPERLSFTVMYDGQSLPVQTQLCGAHWVPSVLAALSVGLAMGIPLAAAVQGVGTVAPFNGRMSPVMHDDGVTFIRDDWKAPLWTLPAALDFMKAAKARRKIIVFGTLSDYRDKGGRGTYVKVARQALQVADYVFFVGRQASRCLGAKRHPEDETVRAFVTVKEMSVFFSGFLRPGDLVLLKGSNRSDHLVRIILARTSQVECWRSACGRSGFCDTCRLVEIPSAPEDLPAMPAGDPADGGLGRLSISPAVAQDLPLQALVGLGNAGEKFQSTRHNVGQRVLDVLADSLGMRWTREGDAMVVRAEWQGRAFYLVKPLTDINSTGTALVRLMRRLGLQPAACILVHDDMDLQFGVVRVRMNGGPGGHNGVYSVLQAFQTAELRRVKIGVGRPKTNKEVGHYVLSGFSPAERPLIEKACADAADRALKLITAWRPDTGA